MEYFFFLFLRTSLIVNPRILWTKKYIVTPTISFFFLFDNRLCNRYPIKKAFSAIALHRRCWISRIRVPLPPQSNEYSCTCSHIYPVLWTLFPRRVTFTRQRDYIYKVYTNERKRVFFFMFVYEWTTLGNKFDRDSRYTTTYTVLKKKFQFSAWITIISSPSSKYSSNS